MRSRVEYRYRSLNCRHLERGRNPYFRFADSQMRIALVLPYNPLLERTGLQNLAIRWGRALNDRGHNATIVTVGPVGTVETVQVQGKLSFASLLAALTLGHWDVVHWLEVWPTRPHVLLQHLHALLFRRRRSFVLTTETPGNLTDRGGGPIGRLLTRVAYSGFVVSSRDFIE